MVGQCGIRGAPIKSMGYMWEQHPDANKIIKNSGFYFVFYGTGEVERYDAYGFERTLEGAMFG